MKKTHDIESK